MRILQPTAVAAQPLLLQQALAGKAFGTSVGFSPPAPAGQAPWAILLNPTDSGVLVTVYAAIATLEYPDIVEWVTGGVLSLTGPNPGLNMLAGGANGKAALYATTLAPLAGQPLGGTLVPPYSQTNLLGPIPYVLLPPGTSLQITVFDPNNLGEVVCWWTET